jgi:chromosome segregation ATPase
MTKRRCQLAISINASPQFAALSTQFSNVSVNISSANNADDSKVSTINTTAVKLPVTEQRLQPEPLVAVTEEGELQSPFISITQQSSQNLAVSEQRPEGLPQQDLAAQQIQRLSGQQQDIRARRESLEEQEQEIEREINQLQQKESEINRKRFQLQQQTSLGQFVNLQI